MSTFEEWFAALKPGDRVAVDFGWSVRAEYREVVSRTKAYVTVEGGTRFNRKGRAPNSVAGLRMRPIAEGEEENARARERLCTAIEALPAVPWNRGTLAYYKTTEEVNEISELLERAAALFNQGKPS